MQKVEPRITKDVYKVLTVESSVASRESFGGTAPEECEARGKALAQAAQSLIGCDPMKTLLLLLALSLSLAACGVRGDPEPPPATRPNRRNKTCIIFPIATAFSMPRT